MCSIQCSCSAEVLEQNNFKLIVLSNLNGDLKTYYSHLPPQLYQQQKQDLDRLERAIKTAVTEKGASPCPSRVRCCAKFPLPGWTY